MKTMYKTFFDRIDEVQVEKETDKSVWINGKMKRKVSDYERFFDTHDEAKDFLIRKAENEVRKAQRQLDYALGKLEKARVL